MNPDKECVGNTKVKAIYYLKEPHTCKRSPREQPDREYTTKYGQEDSPDTT